MNIGISFSTEINNSFLSPQKLIVVDSVKNVVFHSWHGFDEMRGSTCAPLVAAAAPPARAAKRCEASCFIKQLIIYKRYLVKLKFLQGLKFR